MNPLKTFAEDTEFRKLLTFQGDVDLVRAALELARDSNPLLQFDETLAALDGMADVLRPIVARLRSDVEALERVCEALTSQFGFGGDQACYDHADSSYFDRVVATGRGIPITLSLVYVAIGERVGLPLVGVATPGHFLCRFEGAASPLFVDAFRQGRILDPDECIDWIASISGFPIDAIRPTLEPASPRAIITRMLHNLKALHLRQSHWDAAERVISRLLALKPSSFVDRRDLATVSLMQRRPGKAIDLLENSLSKVGDEERASAIEILRTARNQVANWN
jgi:regulator of sirC expression with transglutaminase-like and TPR domain